MAGSPSPSVVPGEHSAERPRSASDTSSRLLGTAVPGASFAVGLRRSDSQAKFVRAHHPERSLTPRRPDLQDRPAGRHRRVAAANREGLDEPHIGRDLSVTATACEVLNESTCFVRNVRK